MGVTRSAREGTPDESEIPRDDPSERIAKLTGEIEEFDRLIVRQTLTFEKYDDPNHPVAKAAARRIEELARRKHELREVIDELKCIEPLPAPTDLADLLETLPDLRPALASYSDEELAELFAAFELEGRYNHTEKTLKLSVTLFPELADVLGSKRPLEAAGRRKVSIAGAGFEPATSGL